MKKVKAYATEWCWTCPICKERHYECFNDEPNKECCDTKFEVEFA